MMNDYKDLHVWQLAVDLAVGVYQVAKDFPKEERFGLVDQIKRSAISISSNIAEGAGRFSKKDYAHFLNISIGSACELETQLIIAEKVGFIQRDVFLELSEMILRIRKMLFKLRESLLS